MTLEPHILLRDMLDSIEAIEEHVAGMDGQDFLQSTKTQDAVVRRLEIIGEAAGQLPAVFVEKHSIVPWGKMIGMRNVMIHQYAKVDFKLVWEAIVRDLPKLKKQLEALR